MIKMFLYINTCACIIFTLFLTDTRAEKLNSKFISTKDINEVSIGSSKDEIISTIKSINENFKFYDLKDSEHINDPRPLFPGSNLRLDKSKWPTIGLKAVLKDKNDKITDQFVVLIDREDDRAWAIGKGQIFQEGKRPFWSAVRTAFLNKYKFHEQDGSYYSRNSLMHKESLSFHIDVFNNVVHKDDCIKENYQGIGDDETKIRFFDFEVDNTLTISIPSESSYKKFIPHQILDDNYFYLPFNKNCSTIISIINYSSANSGELCEKYFTVITDIEYLNNRRLKMAKQKMAAIEAQKIKTNEEGARNSPPVF